MIAVERSTLVEIVDGFIAERRKKVGFLHAARGRMLFALQGRRYRNVAHLCGEISKVASREETGGYLGWKQDRRPA